MKKVLIFLFLFSAASFAQHKYLIYFIDKGINAGEKISKSSIEYSQALNELSGRAIERRTKHLGDDIIFYEDVPLNKGYLDQLKAVGIKIHHELKWFNAASAYLTGEQYNVVKDLPFVSKVIRVKVLRFKERNEELYKTFDFQSAVSDINYGQSFPQLDLSDIPQVHKKGIKGAGIIVGFLDSGFNWKQHESLMNADVLDEYDFVFNDDNTADQFPQDSPGQNDHGTIVFSTVSGFNDSVQIGAAYEASFLLAKTEYVPTETHVEEDNYAAALIWMEARGVDITTSSLGYSEFDAGQGDYSYNDMDGNTTIVTLAAEEAFKRGVVTITSAGNEGNTNWKYITAPADGFNIISVGAVDNSNQLASFSSRGPTFDGRIKPEITAQGVSVFGATASGTTNYGRSTGTSLAAPLAAGVVTLLLSAHPHLLNTQVRKIILETSGNSEEPNNNIGYGLISASNAVAFPNLEQTAGAFRLHKIFMEEKINPSSVKLFYKINGSDYIEETLAASDSLRYSFTFPFQQTNDEIEFYFTFSDSTVNNYREPSANENYRFHYGQLIVSLNLEDAAIPTDYVLSQNYPNPFNPATRIDFVSLSEQKAEMVVIDAIGQKVATIFNDIAKIGLNTVVWNGMTSTGTSAASGVYYYILKMGGKEYGRKMVLLK